MEQSPDNQTADCCKTKYPVMLVHGTALSDRRNTRCWGRIPDALAARGIDVCFGRQDAWGGIESNKRQLAESADRAMKLYGAEKINIIAHSKGGLDARALAATPGFSGKIASITTISTPHRGIGWLSKIWPFIFFLIAVASVLFYPFLRLFYGDKRPNLYMLLQGMTRRGCEKFNLKTPDQPGVFYQSYAGKMLPGSRTKIFSISRLAANRYDGENDGMISVEAAKWGEFRGSLTGGGKRGLSHADEIDFFKRSCEGDDFLYDDLHKYSDVPEFYVRIVSDLAERGF